MSAMPDEQPPDEDPTETGDLLQAYFEKTGTTPLPVGRGWSNDG